MDLRRKPAPRSIVAIVAGRADQPGCLHARLLGSGDLGMLAVPADRIPNPGDDIEVEEHPAQPSGHIGIQPALRRGMRGHGPAHHAAGTASGSAKHTSATSPAPAGPTARTRSRMSRRSERLISMRPRCSVLCSAVQCARAPCPGPRCHPASCSLAIHFRSGLGDILLLDKMSSGQSLTTPKPRPLPQSAVRRHPHDTTMRVRALSEPGTLDGDPRAAFRRVDLR
jgi:hypothetical protein